MRWSDITIGKYLQVMDIVAIDEFEESLMAIAIVNDMTYEQLKDRRLDELNKMIQDFAELNMQDIPEDETMEWNGYHVERQIRKVSVGQMISFDQIKDAEGIKGIHKLIAVLTNPKDQEEFERRAELFYNEMPMTIAYSAMVFFCKVRKAYENHIQTYSGGKRVRKWMLLRSITDGRLSFFSYLRDLFKRGKNC